MRKTLMILAALVLTGCVKEPESSQAAGSDFKVDKLFTVDGCTVHRFKDGGSYIYFTNCGGSTSWQESCGKNCSRPTGVN